MIKKVLIGLVAIGILVYLGLYFFVLRYNYYTGQRGITDYTVLADGQTLIFTTSRSEDNIVERLRKQFHKDIVRPKYNVGYQTVVVENAQLKDYKSWFKGSKKAKLSFGEYWYLTVYTLTDGKLTSKNIDIPELLNKAGLDVHIRHAIPDEDRVFYYNHKHYMELRILGSDRYWINLDDERIEDFSDEAIESIWKPHFPTYFSFSYLYHGIEKDEQFYNSYRMLSFQGEFNEQLPLYETDKRAYEIMAEKNGVLAVLGTPTIEEADKLLELFFPPGTNLFENATIPANYSVDGKEHKVNSEEEFIKYYKYSKDYEGTEEE